MKVYVSIPKGGVRYGGIDWPAGVQEVKNANDYQGLLLLPGVQAVNENGQPV